MARRMKYDVEAKEDANEGEGGFLSRWSARKSQIAKGEDVPDEVSAPKSPKMLVSKMRKTLH